MATTPSPLGTTIAYYNMTPTMGLITGVDCVADDILCRITTGNLWYDPDYGYNVLSLVNATTTGKSAIISRFEAEIKKDVRVYGVVTQSSFVNGLLTIQSQVTLSNGSTFTLVGKPVGDIPTSQLIFTVQTP